MEKKSLNEHLERILKVSDYKIPQTKRILVEMNVPIVQNEIEQPPVQQQTQQNSAQNDANFEREVDAALNQIMQILPQELNKLATTQGDRDGQIELIGQEQNANTPPQPQQTNPIQEQIDGELNEAIGALIAGGALALPAIGNLVSKAVSFLGKKIDSQAVQHVGEKIGHIAEHLHHKYEGIIDKILSPLTKNLDPNTRQKINKGVFYALVATLGGAGFAGATSAVQGGNLGLAAVEGGLTGVKASELFAAARPIVLKILGHVVA